MNNTAPAITPEPDPAPATGDVWALVISDTRHNIEAMKQVQRDMGARSQFGFDKYGTRLQVDNGRDHLVDAYQEALDLVVYLHAAVLQPQETTKYNELVGLLNNARVLVVNISRLVYA